MLLNSVQPITGRAPRPWGIGCVRQMDRLPHDLAEENKRSESIKPRLTLVGATINGGPTALFNCGVNHKGAPTGGQHSEEILSEMGYAENGRRLENDVIWKKSG